MAERRVASWKADDACQVVFTDNAEITRRVLAKFAEYGFTDPDTAEDEAGVTIAEQAHSMGLPWHDDPGDQASPAGSPTDTLVAAEPSRPVAARPRKPPPRPVSPRRSPALTWPQPCSG